MAKRNLLAFIVLLMSASASQTEVATSRAVKADILVKSESAWNGKDYEHYGEGRPQLTVLRLTIPAHTTLPWHTHPMPNAAYILSGHLTVEDQATGQKKPSAPVMRLPSK
jgi:quercetin dioxygenase-like cupin family protein